MKKITMCLLSIFIVLALCGCSQVEKEPQTYTETQGNLHVTYTYNDLHSVIVSKNIYNVDTGLTTEYFYFYEDKGWGEQLIGASVVTITKDGQIIDKFEDNIH